MRVSRHLVAVAVLLVAGACGDTAADTEDAQPLDRDAYAVALRNTDGSFWRRIDIVNRRLADLESDPSGLTVGGAMGTELTLYADALGAFVPPHEHVAAHNAYVAAMEAMVSVLGDVATVGGGTSFPELFVTHPELVAELEAASAELGVACTDLVSPLGLALDESGIRCENWD